MDFKVRVSGGKDPRLKIALFEERYDSGDTLGMQDACNLLFSTSIISGLAHPSSETSTWVFLMMGRDNYHKKAFPWCDKDLSATLVRIGGVPG